ncbi:MAG TPA: UbiA family prenyltransferase [Candidatus Acidoferrum sp.]|jgi:4-hydroxybenzoate polyprenyltransferase|nr:UbiA family prenyltransferase [Candidatus Acidoferrum sp.]
MSDTSVTAGTSTVRRGLRADARFLVQVSRPGLWSTTALFYLLPLGHRDFAHSGRIWLGLLFVLFPLGLLLYGVNDLADAEADQLNPRKGTYMFGSRGSREQLAALKWQIVAAQLPFLAAFLLLVGPRILGWYGILLLAVGIYNAPRFGWKGHPPFDVLIQASYLLVFVLSSWLNNVPQLPWQTFLFGALFAMHSHVFGEVMDIEPDHLSGRKTTATVIGRVTAKFLIVALLGMETLLALLYFHDWIVAGFLALGAVWFALDATLVWKDRKYLPKQMRLFLWGWNIAALLGIFWNWAQSTLTHLP